jgi:hypothetical protein
MTEKELIDSGFNKIDVQDIESDNGYDYYYYSYEVFDNLILISNDSDRAQNDQWTVYNLEWSQDDFSIKSKDQFLQFLSSLRSLQ